MDKCYVFFVVKKNVDEIKRENFKKPIREDEYGTSVMSIQFTKDEAHTLSIKNRYNHALLEGNPDATYKNNLENIAPGLTKSFENTYGLVQFNPNTNFEIKDYVRGKDGKFYKYNYEINNIYYCTDNVIIDNFEVKKLPRERYIVMDYFVLDMKDKKIMLYDSKIDDSFISSIKNIKKIDVLKCGLNKTIVIIGEEGNMIIKLDQNYRIIEVENEIIKKVSDNYLSKSKYIDKLYLNNVIEVGDNFLCKNKSLSKISMDNVEIIGNNFLKRNTLLKKIYMPNVVELKTGTLQFNNSLKELKLPNVTKIGDNVLKLNSILTYIELPLLEEIGDNFLEYNRYLERFIEPNLRKIGRYMLSHNSVLTDIDVSNLTDEYKDNLSKHMKEMLKQENPYTLKLKY